MNRRVLAGISITTLAAVIGVGTNTVTQNNIPAYKESHLTGVKILLDCTGKTDYPHLSKHVLGTVNVVARMKCPNRKGHIELKLTRITLKGRTTLTTHKDGFGEFYVNLAMVCTWKKGPPFRYVATATYTEAEGAHATHIVYRDLKC
mgnify:CR=1 FL=1|jgi:hypothetical protein